jgi:2-phospho-L-lactate guanylyltransferase
MPDVATSAIPWAIVVPVKRLADAKTRITTSSSIRERLALAMALDTVRAALSCTHVSAVVAVSDDERATPLLLALGAYVVPDEPAAGLNPALAHGVVAAAGILDGAVAALSADLPSLRPDDLAAVLGRATRHDTATVADMAGDGTTLLAARSADLFRPAFGANSRSAHAALGAVDLSAFAGESVRRDVDTLADLRAVARLGCGPATTKLLAGYAHLLDGMSGPQPRT